MEGGSPYSDNLQTCSSSFGQGYHPAMHTNTMAQAPVGVLSPTQWGGQTQEKPLLSSVYLNTESYSNYHSTGLLYRPPYLNSDSTNFSFSGIAEPSSNKPGPDRRLPIPTLPHPATTWIGLSATPICNASILADMAAAATDAGGFDKPDFSAVGYRGSHAYVSDKSGHEAAAVYQHSLPHPLRWDHFHDAVGLPSPDSGGQSVAWGSGSAGHAAHVEDRQEGVTSRC